MICNTEDGACYYSEQMQRMQAEIERLNEVLGCARAANEANMKSHAHLHAKLRRFEEREPLVQELVLQADKNWASDLNDSSFKKSLEDAADAVRLFVLEPSNVALDPEGKTGDKPGAVCDPTSQVTENAEVSHLSSVVEQRFRKPNETEVVPAGSSGKPVYAGDERPPHARECGKPGPCEWCDSLQLTEDVLWFENERDEEYEGEAHDRGIRLAAEVKRLQAVVEQHEADAAHLIERASTAELKLLKQPFDHAVAKAEALLAAQPTAPKPVDGGGMVEWALEQIDSDNEGSMRLDAVVARYRAGQLLAAEVRRLREVEMQHANCLSRTHASVEIEQLQGEVSRLSRKLNAVLFSAHTFNAALEELRKASAEG